MGTDIHAAIEVNDGKSWKAIKHPNKYHGKWPDEPTDTTRLDFGRNYSAFAILADVRNGYGFAGCDTGDGFIPISKPKGLPGDVTAEALDALSNEHTPSYVTLDEMLAYDWTRSTVRRGWVCAEVFERWDRCKQWEGPTDWSGGISGRDIEHITDVEMRRRIAVFIGDKCGNEYTDALAAFLYKNKNTYCNISWTVSYTEAAGELWGVVFPLMLKLSREYKGVRLVFDFDS